MSKEESEKGEREEEGEYSLNLKTMKGATHTVTVTPHMSVRELKTLIAQVCALVTRNNLAVFRRTLFSSVYSDFR